MRYAQDYNRLTPKQGEWLMKILDFAQESGGEPLLRWRNTAAGVVVSVGKPHMITSWRGAIGAFEVFDQLGLIRMKQGGDDRLFVLRKKALDYPKWQRLPRLCKGLAVLWDSLRAELRAVFLSIIASVLTTLILRLLWPP